MYFREKTTTNGVLLQLVRSSGMNMLPVIKTVVEPNGNG